MHKYFQAFVQLRLSERTIILTGPFPPPSGGISTHLERLRPLLDQKGWDYIIFNHFDYHDQRVIPIRKRYSWWIAFLLLLLVHRRKMKKVLFHHHVFTWYHYPYLMLFSWLASKRIIITIHNENIFHYGPIQRLLTLWLLRMTRTLKLIVVSRNLCELFKSSHIPAEHLAAYIHPTHVQQIDLPRPGNRYRIVTTLWRLTPDQVHKYGTDLLFTLLRDYPQSIQLFLFVSDGRDQGSEVQILSEYAPGLENNVKTYYGKALMPYLHNFDLLVRPNREDGYGVSIVEALVSGVPALASDTCVRPDDTLLFESGNYQDLKRRYNDIIHKRRSPAMGKHLWQKYDAGARLLAIYQQALDSIHNKGQ